MISSGGTQEDEANDGGEINTLPFQNIVNQVRHMEGETTPMCNRKNDVGKDTK